MENSLENETKVNFKEANEHIEEVKNITEENTKEINLTLNDLQKDSVEQVKKDEKVNLKNIYIYRIIYN